VYVKDLMQFVVKSVAEMNNVLEVREAGVAASALGAPVAGRGCAMQAATASARAGGAVVLAG
jgi:hypothetical protein